ncbi:MAG: hypothetical protein H0T43_04430 [Solirubrobacterales bacterium]|nr:hypothetical protein [Solirubrobacterales bacterium]
MRRVLIALLALLALPPAAGAQLPGAVDLTVPAARDTTPVVLTGARLGAWAAPAEQTAKLPLTDLAAPDAPGHNHYAEPELATKDALGAGLAVKRLLAYRWTGTRLKQIPVQVDEVFTRYLDNSASGFAVYSGQDRHTTYAYDREGFRFRADGPAENPCLARRESADARDPVAGLDADDEIAFMYADAGARLPATTAWPAGIEALREVALTDPVSESAPQRFVYLARAATGGPRPAFDASNGYVRYERDAGADLYAFSQSTYEGYGNAPQGVYCDAQGAVVRDAGGTPKIGRRRPRDGATLTTARYRFRYDGRWLMTAIEISPDGGRSYGPDLVDRFKARAFAQDPGSETPCCGYEEEDANWGGSSTLLGEKVGPVRAIRETWGADSGTNVIRRETFYREEMRQKTWLRVHPIPPLDGIYAQWDFNAGRMTRFYNARTPQGVAVDGRNDEVLGNLDDPCNVNYDANDTSALDQGYRTLARRLGTCELPYHQSVDLLDPLFSDANAGMGWGVTAGPHGSIVDRITLATDTSAGGAAQSAVAVPYYRDDACFDDGTGSDPGPKVNLRSGDEPRTASDGTPRRCWAPADGAPDGSDRYFQGSIATHGVHLLFVADSDNARLQLPVNEIVNEWQMVMLPGQRDARAGEAYGRAFEKPLASTVLPRSPALEQVKRGLGVRLP